MSSVKRRSENCSQSSFDEGFAVLSFEIASVVEKEEKREA